MLEEILQEIAEGPTDADQLCPRPEALREVMRAVMAGDVPPTVLAALLMGLRCRGEQAEHLQAVVSVLLENTVELPYQKPAGSILVDTCGTGGDQHGMVNVSTAAALLAAAAGVPVAKHGNRSVSSSSGSADVLEALGFKIDCPPETSAAMLRDMDFCFLFAPKYHPAMRHAGPTRREIRVRSIFNLAGPLSNPAGATHQLVGVSEPRLVPVMTKALHLLGLRRALVVHGRNREDEISLTTVTEGLELREDGSIHQFVVEPLNLGLQIVDMAELVVDGPQTSAAKIRAVAEGAAGPVSDVINLNFAAVLYLAGRAGDYGTAYQMARNFQESGAAAAHLAQLAERSHT